MMVGEIKSVSFDFSSSAQKRYFVPTEYSNEINILTFQITK